jgi:phosphatidylglycerol---prolipoprotein diacylglyceryl transferase
LFPYCIPIGHYAVHPHFFFEVTAYAVATVAYFVVRRRFGDVLSVPIRWAVLAAAVAGAAIGAKLFFLFEDPKRTWNTLHDPAYLLGGKTIVGALIGGLIAVEVAKRYIGMKQSTGDLYALPLALGIAIGRIGCFLTGLSDNTYGVATRLPWGVDFGDGTLRHPTQFYEIAYLLVLAPVLWLILDSIARANCQTLTNPGSRWATVFVPGDAFKFFMVAYALFRLLCDFIKPYPRIFLGLGGIQWACILVLLYYSADIDRWFHRPVFSQA